MLKFKYHIIKILKEVTQVWGVPESEFNGLTIISDMVEFHVKVKSLVDKYIKMYLKLYEEVKTKLTTLVETKCNQVFNLTSTELGDFRYLVLRREVLYSYIVGEDLSSNVILLKLK